VGTSAAILAGGKARRMGGADKSQLRVGGRTILDRQLEALSGCVSRVMLVGGAAASLDDSQVAVVTDRTPDRGPLGGLDAALDAAGADAVLLLACDMPFVTAAWLGYLVRQLGSADAVVPRTERGYHPLCAVYAQSCRLPVSRRVERQHLRMLDLLDELRVRTIEAAEMAQFGEAGHLLANVNTRADLDAVVSLRNH
jgi:molybdenum cofactor guanylyltransferase